MQPEISIVISYNKTTSLFVIRLIQIEIMEYHYVNGHPRVQSVQPSHTILEITKEENKGKLYYEKLMKYFINRRDCKCYINSKFFKGEGLELFRREIINGKFVIPCHSDIDHCLFEITKNNNELLELHCDSIALRYKDYHYI